jgi:hypothetical protein
MQFPAAFGCGFKASFAFLKLKFPLLQLLLRAIAGFSEPGETFFGTRELQSGLVSFALRGFQFLLAFNHSLLEQFQLLLQCRKLSFAVFDAEFCRGHEFAELLHAFAKFFTAASHVSGPSFAVLKFPQMLSHRRFGITAASHLLLYAASGFCEPIVGGTDVQAECANQMFTLGDFMFQSMQFVLQSSQFAFAGEQSGFVADRTGEQSPVGFDQFPLQRDEAAAAVDSSMPANGITERFNNPRVGQ